MNRPAAPSAALSADRNTSHKTQMLVCEAACGRNDTSYQTRTFPLSRRLVIDACDWGRGKHIIHALAAFDATDARKCIRCHAAQTGERLSFTAFIAICVAKTVAADRTCHAYRRGRKLFVFDDIDIATLVEHEIEGEKLATFCVIRAADKKSYRQIHDEIRAAQTEKPEQAPTSAR